MLAQKRIISIVLSFVMVIGMCATTFAAESIPDIVGVAQDDYMKEAEDTIKDYIRICGIDVSNLSMSQPIPINGSNDENNHAIFLFSSMKCIALMMFTYVNNEYASSFSEGDYVEITDALSKNQNIALVSNEECMVMLTDDSWEVITGNEDFAQETVLSKARASYEKQIFNLTPIVFSDEDAIYDIKSSTSEKTLNVTRVKNKTSPDTGVGLCWAASMVSIIRCRAGKSNLTIDGLYNTLKSKYPSDEYGYPVGTDEWVKRCFSLYNLSYTYKDNGAFYFTVVPIIQDNRPIYAVFKRTGGSHAVVVAGYGNNGENYYYKIMDPSNKVDTMPTLLTVKLSSSATLLFTYNSPNGYTYTQWIRHMY